MSKKFLTPSEVDRLISAIKSSQKVTKFRDRVLVTLMYHHGLRSREASELQWNQIDFKEGTIFIHRIKGGKSGSHPLQGEDIRLLRRLEREVTNNWVFLSRNQLPLSTRRIRELITYYAIAADFDFPISSKSLRHACGYYLANKGIDTRSIQVYLGHSNISNTQIYTELAPNRFQGFWR